MGLCCLFLKLYIEIITKLLLTQIELARKYNNITVRYSCDRAGSHTGIKDRLTLTEYTYSIQVKVAVLEQTQDWEAPTGKDLKLLIPSSLLRLVCLTTILKRLHEKSQLYPLVHTRHHLIHNLLQNHYHYKLKISIGLEAMSMGNH